MSDIDPIEFGELRSDVRTLTKNVEEMTKSFQEMKSNYDGGKGILLGVAIAAGTAGAGMHKILDWFGK